MLYYHCTPDRTDWLEHRRGVNILASAYRIMKFPKIMKHLSLAGDVFLDSGMISAWQQRDAWWAEMTKFVVGLSFSGAFDRVAMLDLPCEPGFLKKNGWSLRKALAVTHRNADIFMNMKVRGTRVLVVQGWEKKHYKSSIERYREKGYFSRPCWVGIGSVCRRSPKNGLYEICEFVRQELPNKHIHAFGIGSPEWVKGLEKIGIDSVDSSTGSTRVAFNRVKGGPKQRSNRLVKRQFAQEMVRVEEELKAAGVTLNQVLRR